MDQIARLINFLKGNHIWTRIYKPEEITAPVTKAIEGNKTSLDGLVKALENKEQTNQLIGSLLATTNALIVRDSIDSKVKEVDKRIEDVKNIKARPGKDGKDADEERVVREVLKRIPRPEGVDEKKVIKEIISKIKVKDGKDAVVDYDFIVREATRLFESEHQDWKGLTEFEIREIVRESIPKVQPVFTEKEKKELLEEIKKKAGTQDVNQFSIWNREPNVELQDLKDVALSNVVDNDVIKYDSSIQRWVNSPESGGGGPGGSDTQVQFNDGGSFGGDTGFTFNKTTNDLTLAGDFSGALVTAEKAGNALIARNTTDSASVQVAIFEGDRATMADNDEAYISLRMSDDAGTQSEIARLTWIVNDVNVGTSLDGRIVFSVVSAGTLNQELILSAFNLFPATNDGLALGASTNGFADLFLAEGGVINWDNGDLTLTQTGNSLIIGGATEFRTSVDDGSSLGNANAGWSDLFLASGAVINFNNGDVLLTHSSNKLALTGGEFTFDSAISGAYRAITALRTLDNTDYFIDCTANTFTVTLPTAVGITGRVYIIKNSGTGVITIDGNGSETIDGQTTWALSAQYDSITIMSDGANWKIIGKA